MRHQYHRAHIPDTYNLQRSRRVRESKKMRSMVERSIESCTNYNKNATNATLERTKERLTQKKTDVELRIAQVQNDIRTLPCDVGHENERRRAAYTLIELLVVIVIIGIIAAMVFPAILNSHGPSGKTECKNNLRQIGTALHGFHDTYGYFPPGNFEEGVKYGYEPAIVRILPYMEQQSLFNNFKTEYDKTPPAHSQSDIFEENPIPTLRCPGDTGFPTPHQWGRKTVTNYHAFMGGDDINNKDVGVFNFHNESFGKGSSFRDIQDGTSNTSMFSERHFVHLPFTRVTAQKTPNSDNADAYVTFPPTFLPPANPCNSKPCTPLTIPNRNQTDMAARSNHPGGVNVLFADGSVRFMADEINEEVWRNLAKRADGEVVSFE